MIRNALLTAVASAALLSFAGFPAANAASTGSTGNVLNQLGSQPRDENDQGLTKPSTPAAPTTAGDLTIEDFVNADQNRDGFLEPKEFKAMASAVRNENKNSSAREKMRNFKKDDANNDGKISARELGVLGAGAG